MTGHKPSVAEIAETVSAPEPILPAPKSVRFAFAWSMGGAIAMSALLTVTTGIMARLLTPAAFGEFAVVAIIQAFALFFGQKGITTAIVQRPLLSSEDMAAALVASLIIGAGLALLIVAGSPLWVAPFRGFDQGRLEALTAIMALSVFFACASSPALGLLQRRMEFRSLAAMQLSGVLIGNGIVAITLARAGFNAAALAWGNVFGQAFTFVAATMLCRHNIRFRDIRSRIGGIALSGFGFSTLRIFDLARSQLQYSFVAILQGPTAVGLYQRSGYLLEMALQFTVARATSVLFPMLCRADETAPLRERTISRFVGLYALFVFPICAGIAAAAGPIIAVILGSKWGSAVPILQTLTIAAAAYYIAHPLGGLLEARQHIGDRLATVALELSVFCILVWTHATNISAVFIALAAAAAAWVTIAFYVVLVTLRYRTSAVSTLLSLLPGIGVAAVIYFLNTALLASIQVPPIAALLGSMLLDGLILAAGAGGVIWLHRAGIGDDLLLGQLWNSFRRSA